jgi:hypothetical protein
MKLGPPPKKPPDEPPVLSGIDFRYTAPMGLHGLDLSDTNVEENLKKMADKANDRQVGGSHYKTGGLQHWDLVEMFGWDYFQGQITKYLMRWRKKNGLEDLEKARHYLDKYIEVERGKAEAAKIARADLEQHADDARG